MNGPVRSPQGHNLLRQPQSTASTKTDSLKQGKWSSLFRARRDSRNRELSLCAVRAFSNHAICFVGRGSTIEPFASMSDMAIFNR
jgi:hypothetical protein